jgi:PPE-repeat protein
MYFGLLPPEVNSARMYAGPGSGSMAAAAAPYVAWMNATASQAAQTAMQAKAAAAAFERPGSGPRQRRWGQRP